MISRFDTLQQIKDFIVAVQKDLMLFERKRALLRKAHLALCSYCWYDGMEIDHDSVPTMSYSLEKIHNDVQANIIALDFTGRAVKTMESFLEIIPDIYERMFADKESELRNTDQSVLKYFQKIRNFFPVNGSECIFWKGFAAEKIEVLQQFLAKADDAITQQDASELRRILTDIFQRQVPLFKKQIQGHLEPLKREHEQLKKTLQSIGAAEIIEKCGKPYWVEVCDTTSMFVRNNAFPLPSVCASFFAEGPVLEYAPNGFEYKRIYLDPNQPSRMRIYGFDSKEEFERILNKGDISIEKDDEIQWAKWVITEIDDIFYYNGETELLPQWKEILEEAVSILKERKDDLLYAARGKALLPYPVLELKPAPRGGTMKKRLVYQLVATILPDGVGGETVQHDLGIFTTLKQAEKFMKGFVEDSDFFCPVYCYSIQFLPLNDEWDYHSERQLNIYSPDGELQISEFNMFTCGAGWDERRNMHVRAYIDIGPHKKPYFVVFNHWRPGLATKCARISFLEPKYELGGSYNKAVWFLNEQEKKNLYEYLKEPREYVVGNVHNTWQEAIWAFNNEVRADDDNRILPMDLPMSDYRKL